jgi:hypothetical protein
MKVHGVGAALLAIGIAMVILPEEILVGFLLFPALGLTAFQLVGVFLVLGWIILLLGIILLGIHILPFLRANPLALISVIILTAIGVYFLYIV